MEVLTFYFKSGSKRQVALSDWYCKPAILRGLAQVFGALFVLTDKYGCRQFTPRWSSSYPIHNITFIDYKDRLPGMFIEFNSFAKPGFVPHFLKWLNEYYDSDKV